MSEVAANSPDRRANEDELRNTDPELLGLRIHTFGNEVLTSIIEDDSFELMNDWQQDATKELQANLASEQIIDLPTRTGKSHLLREFVAGATSHGLKSIIVAPRHRILTEHVSELRDRGVDSSPLDLSGEAKSDASVSYASLQRLAMNRERDPETTEDIDLVMIDEVHRAMGEKTLEGIRRLFPNAVFVTFTATPDYSEDKSASDQFGEKVISRSIVEAIKQGKVPPVRAILYNTNGEIDSLDPSFSDFTPRELAKLTRYAARNRFIVDSATDLVSDGRQGLITTIPGEDLLHAEILRGELIKRDIVLEDGSTRKIRAEVVRGGQADLDEIIDSYNQNGDPDILLYCDVLREGTKLPGASFLINGRPTTSIVNLTQDIGRILEPKDGEMIVVDLKDKSMKQQRTVYDVLELDRCVQGVLLGQDKGEDVNGSSERDSFLRRIFRPGLVDAVKKLDNTILAELSYPKPIGTPYERLRQRKLESANKEKARLIAFWERELEKEGLATDRLDIFGATDNLRGVSRDESKDDDWKEDSYQDEVTFSMQNKWPVTPGAALSIWPGFDGIVGIVPVIPIEPASISDTDNIAINRYNLDPQEDSDVIGKIATKQAIGSKITELSDREAELLKKRFGFGEYEGPSTLEETAEHFGVTRERIRQIESKTLAKLRQPGVRSIYDEPKSHKKPGETGSSKGKSEFDKLSPEEKDVKIEENIELTEVLKSQFYTLDSLFKGGKGWSYASDELQCSIKVTEKLMEKFKLDPKSIAERGRFIETLNRLRLSGDRDLIPEEFSKDLLSWQSELTRRTYPDGRAYPYYVEEVIDLRRLIDEALNDLVAKISQLSSQD